VPITAAGEEGVIIVDLSNPQNGSGVFAEAVIQAL
jgi:hypothetical protein